MGDFNIVLDLDNEAKAKRMASVDLEIRPRAMSSSSQRIVTLPRTTSSNASCSSAGSNSLLSNYAKRFEAGKYLAIDSDLNLTTEIGQDVAAPAPPAPAPIIRLRKLEGEIEISDEELMRVVTAPRQGRGHSAAPNSPPASAPTDDPPPRAATHDIVIGAAGLKRSKHTPPSVVQMPRHLGDKVIYPAAPLERMQRLRRFKFGVNADQKQDLLIEDFAQNGAARTLPKTASSDGFAPLHPAAVAPQPRAATTGGENRQQLPRRQGEPRAVMTAGAATSSGAAEMAGSGAFVTRPAVISAQAPGGRGRSSPHVEAMYESTRESSSPHRVRDQASNGLTIVVKSNLETFRLRNPGPRSAQSPDPRPGALPRTPSTPLYTPVSFRRPVSPPDDEWEFDPNPSQPEVDLESSRLSDASKFGRKESAFISNQPSSMPPELMANWPSGDLQDRRNAPAVSDAIALSNFSEDEDDNDSIIQCVSCSNRSTVWCPICSHAYCSECWGKAAHQQAHLNSTSASGDGGMGPGGTRKYLPESPIIIKRSKPIKHRDYPLPPVFIDGKGIVHEHSDGTRFAGSPRSSSPPFNSERPSHADSGSPSGSENRQWENVAQMVNESLMRRQLMELGSRASASNLLLLPHATYASRPRTAEEELTPAQRAQRSADMGRERREKQKEAQAKEYDRKLRLEAAGDPEKTREYMAWKKARQKAAQKKAKQGTSRKPIPTAFMLQGGMSTVSPSHQPPVKYRPLTGFTRQIEPPGILEPVGDSAGHPGLAPRPGTTARVITICKGVPVYMKPDAQHTPAVHMNKSHDKGRLQPPMHFASKF